MIFLAALDDLDRVLDQGGVRGQDQVFVPLALRRTAGEARWDALGRRLREAGARVHVMPSLARVCVVTLDEMNSGMGPPQAE